ncbi:DNA helicase mcm9 [Dinochytrium kinnereticum]|nr:DNA helicase mcm9 [Dinochytrium kinnereticum]
MKRSTSSVNPEKFMADLRSPEYLDQILDIMAHTDTSSHFSVQFDMVQYSEENSYIHHLIVARPLEILAILDNAVLNMQHEMMKVYSEEKRLSVKRNVHVRCVGVHNVEQCAMWEVPKSAEVGRLIQFEGTVIRTGSRKMINTTKIYQCTKCNGRFEVLFDRSLHNTFPKPTKCASDIGNSPCNGKKFIDINFEPGTVPNHCKDYQEIKVQEQITRLSFGTIPRSITVILEDDITDSCKAGDDITIVGVTMLRFKPLAETKRIDSEVVILANSIAVTNDQAGQNSLTDEIKAEFSQFWKAHRDRPIVIGMYVVKLAVMLVLVGGVPKYDTGGIKLRGDAHILLVGDPGTGKSQFLRYASLLSSRAILTTGIGSTSAGLTVSAVKDSGEWQLEAGALVLADRGICCIDEFGGIREADKTAIHEAMEQQTISVAKAGLVCKLNTRCAILAATNPKGKYDYSLNLEVNVGLGSPLLSRFDLILVLLDNQNDEWDRRVSSFILGLESDEAEEEVYDEESEPKIKSWDFTRLHAYIKFVKSNCNPELSDEASCILQRYYQLQRNSDVRNAARTTVRLLESLIRLTQAHARLMCKRVADVQDAVSAVLLMELSMNASGIASGQSPLHAPFPADPESFYLQQETELLTKMGLAQLISTCSSSAEDEDGKEGAAQAEVISSSMRGGGGGGGEEVSSSSSSSRRGGGGGCWARRLEEEDEEWVQ